MQVNIHRLKANMKAEIEQSIYANLETLITAEVEKQLAVKIVKEKVSGKSKANKAEN